MSATTSTTQPSAVLAKLEDLKFTPYAVAKVVNAALEEAGVERRIPPQMMYNYARNGLIVKGEKGRKEYTRDEVRAFVSAYVTKQLAK